MKKPMVLLSAVAVSIGAYATYTDTGTSFEGMSAGDLDITSTTGELTGTGGFWATNGSEAVTLTVAEGAAGAQSRPAQFTGSNTRYLEVQTTFGNALVRNVAANAGAQAIDADTGLFFDSLMKLTTFADDPVEDSVIDFTGVKISVWLQETDPYGSNNTTNLIVYAGSYSDNAWAGHKYDCGQIADPEGWHRLTVRAISSICAESAVPGFVVFLDGNPVAATSGATGLAVADIAGKYRGYFSRNQLFPSIDQTSVTKQSIFSASFDGTGCVDDLVFTESMPFGADPAVAAEHPWFENPSAVVLAENLPGQTTASGGAAFVNAFHGQGEGEYLGLTYSTNPLQFDLFAVDGTNAITTVTSVRTNDYSSAGFRGVAISKKLGIAMTLAYATSTTMYAFPLAGGAPTAVVKPSTHAFDAGAFSPDGQYFFSNALKGESTQNFYVKWSVSVANGVVTLTKVGSIAASGRGRNLAYARINGRDLVFAMVDTGKVDVIDMTGDTGWTSATLVSGLPSHSYGSLCVSGVNAIDAQGNAATPHLTVATSINGASANSDVLNVYALTVPATGAVSASLVCGFNETEMTAAGFGTIADENRYGNTVYVTDDEATIYFGRADGKLYAAQFVLVTPEINPVGGTFSTDVTVAAGENGNDAIAKVVVRSPNTSIVSDADYKAYFTLTAVSAGANAYTVTAVLDASKIDLDDSVESIGLKLGDIIDAFGESNSCTVTGVAAKPGLYYKVVSSTGVGFANGTTASGAKALAEGSTVNLGVAKPSGAAGSVFFKVSADVAPDPVVE